MHENEPVTDGPLGLPDEDGFLAVLEAEEQRARRHGGMHGLVLIELNLRPGDGPRVEAAAIALSASLRETDLLAQIDHRTFGVLALHCDALEIVVARLRGALESVGPELVASITVRSAGLQLQTTWSAMVAGDQWRLSPATRYLPFAVSMPLSLN